MKKYKQLSIAIFASVFFMFVLFQNINIQKVDAGSSKKWVMSTASVVGKTINEGDFLVEGGIYADNSKLIFDDLVSTESRLIAKSRVRNYKEFGIKDLFTMKLTFNIAKLATDGKISILFGLNSASATSGGEDSGEIVLSYAKEKNSDNDQKFFHIAVNEYVQKDVASVVFPNSKYSMLYLNSDIILDMRVDVNGKIYLSVTCVQGDNRPIQILSGKTLTVDATGYLGIAAFAAQDDHNDFTVSNMEAIAYVYDTVKTIDYYKEDFNKNSYNSNMFYSESTPSPFTPTKIYVDDGKLVFKNVAQGHFTTREKFSNFELKFDLLDLARSAKKDSAGNYTQLISNWFMLGFGLDNYNDPCSERLQATFLHFDYLPLSVPNNISNHDTADKKTNRFVLWNNDNAANIVSMGDDNIWNQKYDGVTINIKLTVVDGLISLYYKAASEADYGQARYVYDLGVMQTGHVRIYTYGDSTMMGTNGAGTGMLNMTIDNLELKNLDNENMKEIKANPVYKSNLIPKKGDFAYTTKPDESDLLGNKLKEAN